MHKNTSSHKSGPTVKISPVRDLVSQKSSPDAMLFAKRGKTHEENREKRDKILYDNIKMTDAIIYQST